MLETLGFGAPARGPELDSQKSFSIGCGADQLASFEPFRLVDAEGQEQTVIASRIFVNKTTVKDGSNSKVILR